MSTKRRVIGFWQGIILTGTLALLLTSPAAFGQDDGTGTDPRDFSSKFMPYYLRTEMDNGIESQQYNLFGMQSFGPNLAMTYDWAVYKDMHYTNNGLFQQTGGVGNFNDVSTDGSTTGFGDLGLRVFYKNPAWTQDIDEENTWTPMFGMETTIPAASDDVLGADTTVVSPMFVLVTDIPGDPPFGLGFFAMMNFYDFDVDEGPAGQDVERYRGRWFWMQPLSKPGPELTDGLYLLSEFQPVYDFRTDDFDFWMAPEFGKMFKEGLVGYVKPGWGVDLDVNGGDRKFTLEIGCRYFFE